MVGIHVAQIVFMSKNGLLCIFLLSWFCHPQESNANRVTKAKKVLSNPAPNRKTSKKRSKLNQKKTKKRSNLKKGETTSLEQLLKPDSSNKLSQKALTLDYAILDKELRARLPRAPKGSFTLADGTQYTPKQSRAKAAYKALKATKGKSSPTIRDVVITGGGPSGLLAAIQAYHAGHNVTIIDNRTSNTLPIVWNNRQATRDILHSIDPVLEKTMFARRIPKDSTLTSFQKKKPIAGEIVSADIHQQSDSFRHANYRILYDSPQQRQSTKLKDARRPQSNHPIEIGVSTSNWQTQARDEVTRYWDRVKDLAAQEKVQAKQQGRTSRIRILRGYQITDLPSQGNVRSLVVRKMVDRMEKGKLVKHIPKNKKIPEGWRKVKKPLGKEIKITAPDDLIVAEGANSPTRKLAGAKVKDVGPSTQFIAGYIQGKHIPAQWGLKGVLRRGIRVTKSDNTLLKQVALSHAKKNGIWALPEVDAKLNFDSPESIQKYFGKAMSKETAIRKYYAKEMAPLLGGVMKESEIEKRLSFGPGVFTLQSHVAGPVAANANNVHLIGDARGNSHFLSSLGKVTGTGTHQLSLGAYWDSLASGTDTRLASALLDKRLNMGTRAWLKIGLRELQTVVGPTVPNNAAETLRERVTQRKQEVTINPNR